MRYFTTKLSVLICGYLICELPPTSQAFSQFGPVERAIVVTDDRGRPTGKGIVEFANKASARKALERCTEGALLLTT